MEFPEVTYVFALALCVSALGGLVWITYDLLRRVRVLESLTSTSASALRSYAAKLANVEKSATEKSSTALAARVDDLAEAVAKLSDTHRKFAGRMDRRYQLENGREADPNEDVDDPKWLALRRAQEAHGGPAT